MKIGYIAQYDLELNPHLTEKFKFKEATFTRRISSRGDRVYSKMLAFHKEKGSECTIAVMPVSMQEASFA